MFLRYLPLSFLFYGLDCLLVTFSSTRTRTLIELVLSLLFQGEWILSGRDVCNNSKLRLFMYDVKCVNIGSSKDPFLTQVSDFAVLFGNELDAEVSCFYLHLWCGLINFTL